MQVAAANGRAEVLELLLLAAAELEPALAAVRAGLAAAQTECEALLVAAAMAEKDATGLGAAAAAAAVASRQLGREGCGDLKVLKRALDATQRAQVRHVAAEGAAAAAAEAAGAATRRVMEAEEREYKAAAACERAIAMVDTPAHDGLRPVDVAA